MAKKDLLNAIQYNILLLTNICLHIKFEIIQYQIINKLCIYIKKN